MVNVYDNNGNVIGTVKFNNNLDVWNGNNWQNGGLGMHLGITRMSNGEYVQINGTNWEGREDHAEIISEEKAFQLIMKYSPELLEEKKFENLKKFEKNLLTEME